jgi:hypothetical protein
MIGTCVHTTLQDRNDEPFALGPYLFADEPARTKWKDDLDVMLADLSFELLQPYISPDHIVIRYEDDIALGLAAPAPTPDFIVAVLRQMWHDDELGIVLPMAA